MLTGCVSGDAIADPRLLFEENRISNQVFCAVLGYTRGGVALSLNPIGRICLYITTASTNEAPGDPPSLKWSSAMFGKRRKHMANKRPKPEEIVTKLR